MYASSEGYGKSVLMYMYADLYSKAIGLNFDLSLHIHPYFMYASSIGSGKSAHMRRLARAYAAHL